MFRSLKIRYNGVIVYVVAIKPNTDKKGVGGPGTPVGQLTSASNFLGDPPPYFARSPASSGKTRKKARLTI